MLLVDDSDRLAAENKMDARNLAIVLAPCLVRSTNLEEDIALCKSGSKPFAIARGMSSIACETETAAGGTSSLTSVLQIMIENYILIFEEGPAPATDSSSANSSQSISPAQAHKTSRRIFAGTAGRHVNGHSKAARPAMPARPSVGGIFARES